jgi:hypothetical protein
MSCLCYCVCKYPGNKASPSLRGVGGHPVYLIPYRRLSAVVSRITATDLVPDLTRVKAFEQVVNSYHRHGTVIPLRYGCVVPEEAQILERLGECGDHYETLLHELDGCVEMGLRILLPSGPWGEVIPGGPGAYREVTDPQPPKPGIDVKSPGLAYLTARKAHYSQQDRLTNNYRQLADFCCNQLQGLFVKQKMEAPSTRLPLLSLYFLIPEKSEVSFRQIFRQMAGASPARWLLSGPWPPYNFVTASPGLI